MAVTLKERRESRANRARVFAGPAEIDDSWDLAFYVSGSNDECEIKAKLEDPATGLPTTWHGQPLKDYRIRCVGDNRWECRAAYTWRGPRKADPTVLPTSISYSSGGGRTTITESIATHQSWPYDGQSLGDIAPDFEGALEWDGERVNGTSVYVEEPRYSETWIWEANQLFSAPGDPGTHSNMFTLWSTYSGTVHGYKSPLEVEDSLDPNRTSAPVGSFRGWTDGEVLFLGANLRQIGEAHYEVTYDFRISPTKEFYLPKSIDDRPRDPDPEGTGSGTKQIAWGHNLLWMYFGQNEAQAGNTGSEYQVTAPVPKFVYDEQVYPMRDFQWLGVGLLPFDPTVGDLIGC